MPLKPVDTAILVVVGPCIDDTDFKSLETAIAYNASGMSLDWIQEKTDGTTVKTDLTLTTSGDNDWTHIGNGYYSVEITAAQNNEEGVGWVAGMCTGVLPFESPHYDIVPTQIYNSLVKGSDLLDVNASQLGGTAQTGRDIGASVLLSPGTGTGQISLASGAVTVGTNSDKTAYQLAADQAVNVTKFNGTTVTARDIGASVLLSNGTDTGQISLSSGQVTVGTLASAAIASIWNALTSGLTTAGSIGKLLVDNINATISSRSTYAGADTAGTTTLLSRIGTALTITGGKVDVNDKTGFALSSAGIAGIWNALTSGMSTAGSIGKRIIDYLTGDIFARLGAPAGASVSADIAAVNAKTTNLPATPAAVGSAMTLTAAYDAAKTAASQDSVNTISGYIDTEVASILAAVDTEVAGIKAKTDGLNFTGTDVKATLDGETVIVGTNNDKTGYALTAAYDAAKTAASQSSVNTISGYIDTEVAAILAAVDTEVAAIKAKTDNLPADPADQSAVEAAITAAHATTNGKIDAVDDYVDTEIAAIKAVTDKLDTALELDEAVYRFTANALELAPVDGAAPTAAAIRAEIDANSTQLAAIKTKTDGLNFTGTDVKATLDGESVTVGTNNDKTGYALTVAYDAAKTAASQSSVNTIDGIVDAILEDTGTTIPATLSTISGYIDTEVASILAAVDTEVAGIKAKTDGLNFTGTDVKATLDGETVTVGANNDKTGYALTVAYDAAKTAASQTSVDAIDGIVDSILEDTGTTLPGTLTTISSYIDTEVAAIKAVTDKLDTALELDEAVYRFTANALELAPVDGAAPTAAAIRAEIDASSTQLAAILATIDGAGSGPVAHDYTVTVDGVSCADCLVIMSTDSARANPIHRVRTNALGVARFWPDLPAGTKVYLWRYKTGTDFSNPDTEVIHA